MDWLSNVASGAGGFMDSIDTSGGGFWDGVLDFGTTAFNWLGENPEAANLIGGVAMGMGQAYMQGRQAKGQRAFEREMHERRRQDRQVKPGEIGHYGSHRSAIAGKGLLTSGMITNEEV